MNKSYKNGSRKSTTEQLWRELYTSGSGTHAEKKPEELRIFSESSVYVSEGEEVTRTLAASAAGAVLAIRLI
jgi:hypothetical protein